MKNSALVQNIGKMEVKYCDWVNTVQWRHVQMHPVLKGSVNLGCLCLTGGVKQQTSRIKQFSAICNIIENFILV